MNGAAATTAGSRPSAGAIVRAVLLFFVGFFFCAALLHVVVGDMLALYGEERSEKLEIMRRSGNGTKYGYTSAMFGSSHVHQGFDPRQFDAELAGSPIAVRSFNLGVDGGAMIEERVMALNFLEHLQTPDKDQPCFVMLETTAEPSFSLIFTTHLRQINILDWRALQLILQFPPEGYLRPNRIHHRLATFTTAFYHAINLGMLSDRVFRPPLNENAMAAETIDDRRGLHTVPTNAYEDWDLKRAFSRERFPPTALPGKLLEGNASVMQDLHNAPNGDRTQLVWVVMPTLKDLMEYKVYPPAETTSFGEVPVLDLGRPDLYPQLYDRSLWLDSQHVNEQGAKLLSGLIAKQLLAWSRSHPVQRCGG